MKIIYLNHQQPAEGFSSCVATLGFFDGVHRGHQFLMHHVIEEAQSLGLPSMVITLDCHPRQVLHSDYQPELLTTLDAKLQLIEKTGVDIVVVLHFDETLARLSAREFMAGVLKDQLNVSKLVIGYDNRFGHNRAEGFDDYVRYGQELGIQVIQSHPYEYKGIQVSSSVVRAFLKEGEVDLANSCLGYAYTLTGKVVDGFKQGRELGYPTANLDTEDSGQLIPACGVYATQVKVGESDKWLPAMTDIGTRPTFGDFQRTIETYIFNFHSDIYGCPLALSFVHRIRAEKKFDNVTLLVEQLKEDERMVEELFRKNHANE
ncbi:MAG: bifunctional riboflavin kinase/FAD synthetase [Prevotella sp.]|nr:bifunctional riboflavin kinase/FAD synthetase [Prevotella sp.]